MDSITKNIDGIFELFTKYGQGDYIGEKVTQREHMIQCAMLYVSRRKLQG